MKKIGIFIIIILVGLSFWWFSKEETTGNKANTLVYGSHDYTSINPALYEHGEINSLIFSGLFRHDKDNQLVEDLVDTWEYKKEEQKYYFHLKENVKWQDGEEFTAEDVKFTLEAILDPNNLSEIASNYEEIKEVEVPDKYTVILTLSKPNVALPDYLTVGMLPKHLLDGKDMKIDSFNQNPVGTGAYRMKKWELGQYIQLEKNPFYYGKQPQIEEVIFKIVPEEKMRSLQLKSKELDLAQVSPKDANALEQEKHLQVYDMKTADYRGIMYNFFNPFWNDKKEVIQAISYCIDAQSIVDTVLLKKGEVAYSPLQGTSYYKKIEGNGYSKDKAKQLLEQNGWKLENGIYKKNGVPLSFTITCMEGDPVRVDIAKICASQINEIGADIKVEVKADIDWEGQEAFLIGWGSPFDPDDHTYKVFGTDKGANYSGYSNKKIDRILEQARSTEDKQERKRLYDQFQEEFRNDPPYTLIAYVDALYVANNRLKGIPETMILGHHGVGIFNTICDWEMEE